MSTASSTYAVQDGTILYHTIKWFTPSSTVSSSGTTVTSIGTQFTSGMVGAKLTISGESKIITAYTSTTVVTVSSAYSVNYSGVAAGSWGVYSKVIQITANQYTYFSIYDSFGVLNTQSAGTQFYISNFRTLNNNLTILDTGLFLGGNRSVSWSNSLSGANEIAGAKDIGLRRNAAGLFEIYDGVTNGNRRDLSLRRLLAGTATDDGINSIQAVGTIKATSSLQVGDNTNAASATNVGAIRYRESGNNSYSEMCMRVGASAYAWVTIVENNW
jgi:hypothetical protein